VAGEAGGETTVEAAERAMKRSKPLRRKTWLRARSLTNSYRRRERDLPHLRKVKSFPCVVPELISSDPNFTGRTPCSGPVQADHVGRRGFGQKCSDRETMSICRRHHGERTDFRGTFKLYDQGMMRGFLDDGLRLTEQRIAAREATAR
jgi:hypothetical protein